MAAILTVMSKTQTLAAIVPGHSDLSRLLDYVSDRISESEMPPKAKSRQTTSRSCARGLTREPIG